MPNQKNKDAVNDLKEKISKSKSLVFAEYHGMDSNKVNELRKAVREAGAELEVTKNTLLKVALKEQGLDDEQVAQSLTGPVATVFAYNDAVAPIKALTEFIKKFELPVIKSGIVDGVFAPQEKITLLSQLPSRDELIAKVVGSLKSPLYGLVNTFAGTNRKFVYALSAIAEKKTKESNS